MANGCGEPPTGVAELRRTAKTGHDRRPPKGRDGRARLNSSACSIHRVARAADAVNRIDCSKARLHEVEVEGQAGICRASTRSYRGDLLSLGGALRQDRSASRKRGGKLVSRVELQLAENAREVTLDSTRGDEQHLCDLAVGQALAGELGDSALAGRQRVEPCEQNPTRARARGTELRFGVFGKRLRTRAISDIERVAKEFSRFGAAIAPPKQSAEIGESARSFQLGVSMVEYLDRLTEQGCSALTAGHDSGGARRHT